MGGVAGIGDNAVCSIGSSKVGSTNLGPLPCPTLHADVNCPLPNPPLPVLLPPLLPFQELLFILPLKLKPVSALLSLAHALDVEFVTDDDCDPGMVSKVPPGFEMLFTLYRGPCAPLIGLSPSAPPALVVRGGRGN